MKTTLLIAFIICANIVSAQWNRINNSPTQAHQIYFYNAQTGYVLKNDTIFKTINGGSTWTDIHAGFPTYTNLEKIEFISPDTGFVYTKEFLSFAYPVSIYRTINGGITWQSLIGPYDGSTIDFHLAGQNDYYFRVTSQWLTTPTDSIFHTINGGNSFTKTGNATQVQYNQQINNLVVYKDSTTPSQKDLFYKSINGGATWNLLLSDSTVDAAFIDHQFLNSNDGYALLYQYNSTDLIDSKIYKTSNGGLNWLSYTLPSVIAAPQVMHFTDANTGYIISYTSSLNMIYKTIDGGQTWNLDFTGNINEYFIGGFGIVEYFEKLYVLGNDIITNNVSTFIKDLQNDQANFSLYPNPSNGTLTIESNLSKKTKNFIIVDITGKEVYAFSSEQSLTQTVDISFLNSGLYLLKYKDTSQSVLFVKE